MKKRQGQKGFTLIELMIVVAVIGVLSAIAIPQYQNYVHKAELGAGLATVSALKINVEDFIATNGDFPDNSTGQKPDDVGASEFANGTISFAGTASGAAATSGSIVVEFSSGIATGEKIQIDRSDKGKWVCKTTSTNEKAYPKGCSVI
ncbi:prepilin-type N-terminal cleavage/methylation domain-containing protein [Aliivibrio fischeri]|uniref:Prepilin-type N-terminal cleavage/methylation domain-containing protein n=1 Tax=Aliivibrio fischeri TaxID=668 RepID=A0A6N3Z7E1_ALIFS|nr:pilin [Aliivibrio fischeri]MUK45513.1 prepilin-type N-terminal cleavage/methylation domain-containing protein [Aliivibrio fischeri]MUK81218.1 prepilin-type N-terminal cleavage/methylation domain-containing protein [Aliivibrio fischeri]MUK84016.1 prepilin-type N-terminal cleavage/methylation domain-containing protein [Aliivibrio fischeri]